MTAPTADWLSEDLLAFDAQPLGDGGQGRIHRVTAIRGRPVTRRLAYKKYKPQFRDELDAEALRRLVSFRRGLHGVGRKLIGERTAWPETVVADLQGRPIGFLMGMLPEHLAHRLDLPGTDTYCQVQHLLNGESYLRRVGIPPVPDRWRVEFLRDVAETLDVLHRHGITVGDFSPLNIFPSLTGSPRCFFVDCDAMTLNGRSVLGQAQTRGWEAPDGEDVATVQSDAYKFALLAARLFAGEQETRDVGTLAGRCPQLGTLARNGLRDNAWGRPLPAHWVRACGTVTAAPAAATAVRPPMPSTTPAAPVPARWRARSRRLLSGLFGGLLAIEIAVHAGKIADSADAAPPPAPGSASPSRSLPPSCRAMPPAWGEADGGNLRRDPSTKESKIMTIGEGQLEILCRASGETVRHKSDVWYWVHYDGQFGYVSGAHVTPAPEPSN